MKKNKRPIDIRKVTNDNYLRFCNFFDDEAIEFEDNLRKISPARHVFVDDSGTSREIEWPNILFWQSYKHFCSFDESCDAFYLLQMYNEKRNCFYQIAVREEVSTIPLFKFGEISKWVMLFDIEAFDEQRVLITELIGFLKKFTNISRLRIQSYIPGEEANRKSSIFLKSIGFVPVKEKSYTKTRFFDLRDTVENILKSFSSNERARLKIKDKDFQTIEINSISELSLIPCLQKALNDSFSRTLGKGSMFDFVPLVKSAINFENEVLIFGFYFKELLGIPKAFITGVRHLNVTEFSVGGSVSESQLRQYPFNHILMWNLALETKNAGGQFIDLGGIAQEFNQPKLAGINKFKRFFPGFELTVGHEMQLILKPNRVRIYNTLKNIHSFLKL